MSPHDVMGYAWLPNKVEILNVLNPAACPPVEEWEQFLLGQTDEERSRWMEEHVGSCETCQSGMLSLGAEDAIVRAMRKPRQAEAVASQGTGSLDAPSSLVNLLVPHFKRMATKVSLEAAPQTDFTAPTVIERVTQRETTTSAPPYLVAGDSLGPYLIESVLGQGGMGTVLRAYDPRLKRAVAIKIVHGNLLSQPGMRDRFLREAQAAAAVEHDHIVPIFGVESYDSIPCIVMPLLRGQTLAQRLKDVPGPWDTQEILRIARETASGLAEAHQRGLIHRDIKPANLWLEAPAGRVKILDFGLAVDPLEDQLEAGRISGTPGFLAPEQARGLPVDARTDLFSLGCLLYRLATGNIPFTGVPRHSAFWTVLAPAPLPAHIVNPKIPADLSELIARMLAREPAARPASSAEVLAALDVMDACRAERQRGIARRRVLWGLGATAVLSGVAAASGAFLIGPPRIRPVAVTFRGDLPGMAALACRDGVEQRFELGEPRLLALAPGEYRLRLVTPIVGRRLVPEQITIHPGKTAELQIALVGEVARQSQHSQPVTGVAVLPGTNPPRVLSVSLDRTLIHWDTADKSVTSPRFVNLPYSARCLALSPDGTEVATAGGNKQQPVELIVNRWEVESLRPRGLPHAGHLRLITLLAYSPSGTQLASAGAEGMLLWELTDEQQTPRVLSPGHAVVALVYTAEGQQLLTAGPEGGLVAWDARTGAELDRLVGDGTPFRSLALVPGGVAAGGERGPIRLWSATQGLPGKVSPFRDLTGHQGAVLALAVTADGRQLLSGGQDGTVRVWSLPSGQPVCVVAEHAGRVNSLSMVENGRQVVSGSSDGTVRLWQLPFP